MSWMHALLKAVQTFDMLVHYKSTSFAFFSGSFVIYRKGKTQALVINELLGAAE